MAHPIRLLPLAFFALIIVGAGLLLLPFARTGEGVTGVMPALFTSASAVTVTGLSTVDTATYWTPAGQGIMLVLVEIGGLGIIALATLLVSASAIFGREDLARSYRRLVQALA